MNPGGLFKVHEVQSLFSKKFHIIFLNQPTLLRLPFFTFRFYLFTFPTLVYPEAQLFLTRQIQDTRNEPSTLSINPSMKAGLLSQKPKKDAGEQTKKRIINQTTTSFQAG